MKTHMITTQQVDLVHELAKQIRENMIWVKSNVI